MNIEFKKPHTEAERRALEILKTAPLREDADYAYLATLIDDAVSDLVDAVGVNDDTKNDAFTVAVRPWPIKDS